MLTFAYASTLTSISTPWPVLPGTWGAKPDRKLPGGRPDPERVPQQVVVESDGQG